MVNIFHKKILLVLLSTATITAAAQSNVQFGNAPNWQQVLANAKAANKYIFLDCYATWCAPCKMMEKDIYTQSDVAGFYNESFINVKVQLDRTVNDDKQVKGWYNDAAMLQNNYKIEAFPTFLFFDPEGKLVLQRSGAMDAAAFIQLGKDALNGQSLSLDAQDFRPGELDTAKEKALIDIYANTNNELAGRVAADYLSRLAQSQLSKESNGKLMVQFADNPQMMQIVKQYISELLDQPISDEQFAFIDAVKKRPETETAVTAHFRSLSQHQFADTANLILVSRFFSYPGVKRSAIKYIQALDHHEIAEQANLVFIAKLNNEPDVQQIAIKYFDTLNNQSIYTKPMLSFIAAFTASTGSIGMDIFLHHAKQVNAVMGSREFARNQVIFGLLKKYADPSFARSKMTGKTPDWAIITNEIKNRYGSYYATVTTDYAKMNWYLYLCRDKKQKQYLPQYLETAITKMQELRNDTLASPMNDNFNLNNLAYSAFIQLDNIKQLGIVTNWMREVTGRNPNDLGDLDTYACLLYRTGKPDSAIMMEQKALQMAATNKDDSMIQHATTTIAKMKGKEEIWKEKEYQE